MFTVDDHRAAIADLLDHAVVAAQPLADCANLVLAKDVPAGVALPPFDNSAMDGFAVRSEDLAGAEQDNPISLPVTQDIPAGRTDVPTLEPATAHRIMTGAPMPAGADSVVPVEQTDAGAGFSAAGQEADSAQHVSIYAVPEKGAHVRHAGEDVNAGALALTRGTVLGPAQLGLAAAIGTDKLSVYEPPRILIVSTGSELVEPPAPLRHGQIYESNSLMLASAIRALGCPTEILRSVADDVFAFRAAIEPRLPDFDLVVTSGGVSAGAYEVVKDALTDVGLRFSKIAMQPGGPQGCGRWNGVPIITLPGNPVSVLVSYEVFLRPALLARLGHTSRERTHVRARLTESLRSPRHKRQFRRGYYIPPQLDGTLAHVTGVVGPRGGPGSHLLAAFASANCLIVLGEDVTEAEEGDEVDVLLL